MLIKGSLKCIVARKSISLLIKRNSTTKGTHMHKDRRESKMKLWWLLVLSTVSLCEANKPLCQFYNGTANSLEYYCTNYKRLVPENCVRNRTNIEPLQVHHLKIGGCDSSFTLDTIKQLKNIRSLDISYSGYRSLNWFNLKLDHLHSFNVSHNELLEFRWHFLKHMINIREIDLSHNKLGNIYKDNSTKAHKLIAIDLSFNYLRYIERDTFSDSMDLNVIDFSENLFRGIPPLHNNKQLKWIRLENNRIETFDYCMYLKMEHVSIAFPWLNVRTFGRGSTCEPEFIPPTPFRIVQSNQTEGVFVTFNQTHEIRLPSDKPNELQIFENLISFTAGHNSFDNLPLLLNNFGSSVHMLDLNGNSLNPLNCTVFQRFSNLTELSLSNTELSEFDFGQLTTRHLATLDISWNCLKLVKNVFVLQSIPLQKLDVSHNQLTNAPEIIHHIKAISIYDLDVSGNFVGQLNASTFYRFVMLRTLKLSNTNLTIAYGNPFVTMRNLRVLDISHNQLGNVNFTHLISTLSMLSAFDASDCNITNASDLFDYFGPNLQHLNLSGNSIETINSRTFEMLKNLKCLNLSRTNIVQFDFSALQYQNVLHVFDLSNNKLRRIEFAALPQQLDTLYLNGNNLVEVDNQCNHSLSLAIAQNRLTCIYLRQFLSNRKNLTFIDDPLHQKHALNCRSSIQGISDFLGSVYDTVKFW